MDRFIKIKVKAGSKKNEIRKIKDDEYIIETKAERENGNANKSVLNILSKHLNIPVQKFHIIKGHTATSKIIKIFD
jgi:uncharacterized protein YggU (UPF0235/DUF167 family)